MKHRYVWADTPPSEGGTRIAVMSMQGLYHLTMKQIGAHSITQRHKGKAAGEGKPRGGAVSLCYGAVSVISSGCFPIIRLSSRGLLFPQRWLLLLGNRKQ